MSDATKLKPFLDRVEHARADYFMALGQISDDARAAGLCGGEIIGELAQRAWLKEKVKDPSGQIYFAKVQDLDVVKVGFSINVADRMRALRNEHKRDFDVLGTVSGTMSDERWFHRLFWWCQDRTLRGNEFFRYSSARGLVRIFIANADQFPFNAKLKQETATWVNTAREKISAKHNTHAAALAELSAYFEHTAAQTVGGGQ